MITQEIIDSLKINSKDVGSAPFQIASLTAKILHLSEHSKVHKKDKHSNRGLIMAISTRKKLLTYLKRTNETHYKEVLAKLGLRK